MKTFLKLSLFICGIIFTSCNGVKFASAPVNKALPETFTTRSIYPAGVAGYEFQDLVGNILLIKEDETPLRVGLIRPASYSNEVIPITDANNYYRSRIQKKADVEASTTFLSFSAGFSAEQMAELTLVDIARAGIVFNDTKTFQEVVDSAKVWVTKHPNIDTSYRRLWIKSVVLTRRIYNDFTKIEANASGQKSDVVGVSTGVYSKDENSIKSVIVSFEAFDIDKLVANSIKSVQKESLFSSYEDILESSLVIETINGQIKDL